MSKAPEIQTQWLLADRTLTPIVSSVPLPTLGDDGPSKTEQKKLQSLTTITTTAVSAFDSAARLGLGLPQRVVFETKSGGPVVLHAYLNPPSRKRPATLADKNSDERDIVVQAREDLRPLTATTDGASDRHQDVGEGSADGAPVSEQSVGDEAEDGEYESESGSQQSPLLIASVIAVNVGEGKKAVGGLERAGREIQRALILERQQEESQDIEGRNSDG